MKQHSPKHRVSISVSALCAAFVLSQIGGCKPAAPPAPLVLPAAWDGPKDGPPAQPNIRLAFIADDLRNGGVLGVAEGVREAAGAIGWELRIHDAAGSVDGRRRALAEARAEGAKAIVVGGFNAEEFRPELLALQKDGIACVGWHAGSRGGPLPEDGLACNVTTDPNGVAVAAASAVDGKDRPAGIVVFTDSRFGIATVKADAMVRALRDRPGCTVLEVRDVAISGSAQTMPEITRELLAKYGPRWTHALAINDIYFDYATPVFAGAGLPPEGAIACVSAGDGSGSAFDRIQAGLYQTGTVPEPLNLQGWQLVDELNRRLAGRPASGYAAPVQLVTRAALRPGAGRSRSHDPDNGYREAYRTLWRR